MGNAVQYGRVLKLARELAGLPVISYYLKLYAAEIILDEKERDEDATQTVVSILDEVEEFRNSADDEGTKLLLHDKEKALAFAMNLAMSIYNGILVQIQNQQVDSEIRKGLWCCIDLFQCCKHLWGDSMDEVVRKQCDKRIKYAKYYLMKLKKGELGSSPEVLPEGMQESSPSVPLEDMPDPSGFPLVPGEIKDRYTEPKATTPDLTDGNQPEEEGDMPTFVDDEEEAPTFQEEPEEPEELEQPEDPEETAFQKEPSVPLEPTPEPTPEPSPKVASKATPKETPEPEPAPEPTPEPLPRVKATPPAPSKISTLKEIMSREEIVHKAQKSAKYAISALNYDDIATAKKELKAALQALEELPSQ